MTLIDIQIGLEVDSINILLTIENQKYLTTQMLRNFGQKSGTFVINITLRLFKFYLKVNSIVVTQPRCFPYLYNVSITDTNTGAL